MNGPLPRSRGWMVCGASRPWLAVALAAWVAFVLPSHGLSPRSVARADDAHAANGDAHGGEGHHVEIGHNPPPNMSLKDFESPVDWRRTDLALWSLAVFVLLQKYIIRGVILSGVKG